MAGKTELRTGAKATKIGRAAGVSEDQKGKTGTQGTRPGYLGSSPRELSPYERQAQEIRDREAREARKAGGPQPGLYHPA